MGVEWESKLNLALTAQGKGVGALVSAGKFLKTRNHRAKTALFYDPAVGTLPDHL